MEKIKLAFICPDIGIDFGRSRIVFYMIMYLAKNFPNSTILLITNKHDQLFHFDFENVKIVYIPIEIRGRNLKKIVVSIFNLRKIICDHRIDIIHSHHRYSDFIMYYSSLLLKVKTISTVHSFVHGYKFLSFKSDKIICVSEAIKKHLNEEFVNDKNIKVIHNGMNYDNIQIGYKSGKKTAEINILCIGRLDYEKGQDVLLKSLENLWAKNLDIHLTIVGDYSINEVSISKKQKEKFYSEFRQLVNRNSNKIEVKSTKSTPWDEIYQSDLIIIPSRIEPFGLVALEAGSASKCVIASNIGGLSEIINDKKNGLLFESENVVDLGDKIKFVCDNEDLRLKYGENLRDYVTTNFSLDKMMGKYISTYQELIEN